MPEGEPAAVPAAAGSVREADLDDLPAPMPSILVDDEDEVFAPTPDGVSFDAEEDLDIPDFLKS